MDPAFPDLVGQLAVDEIDDHARVWIVERGMDGRLGERLDLSSLPGLTSTHNIAEIVEALVVAAAEQDVAETRIW